MKKLIVANWKCNPDLTGRAVRLAQEVLKAMPRKGSAQVVLCPPFVFLEVLASFLKPKTQNLKPVLGAQNVFWEERGAFTGEVSPLMLKNSRVEYVIIGHSDRRRLLGETDEMVNKKVLAALKAGLKVILCVGEPERELGIKNYELRKSKKYVAEQLKKDLKGVQNLKPKTQNLIVCYEPVWAISTTRSKTSRDNADTPESAAAMIRFIKNVLKPKTYNLKPVVIYGGSVNPKNARGFLSREEIDGALVGNASLTAKDFVKVIEAADG